MRTLTRLSLALAVLSLALPAGVRAGESGQGQQLYDKYCSSCHGKDGRGNGSVSAYLKINVPDLSLLKRNNKGIYPLKSVMTAIDGSRVVRSHGEAAMPVWGEVFEKEARAVESAKYPILTSLLKTQMIAEHIATLQR